MKRARKRGKRGEGVRYFREKRPSYQLECQQNAAIPLLEERHIYQTASKNARQGVGYKEKVALEEILF